MRELSGALFGSSSSSKDALISEGKHKSKVISSGGRTRDGDRDGIEYLSFINWICQRNLNKLFRRQPTGTDALHSSISVGSMNGLDWRQIERERESAGVGHISSRMLTSRKCFKAAGRHMDGLTDSLARSHVPWWLERERCGRTKSFRASSGIKYGIKTNVCCCYYCWMFNLFIQVCVSV